MTSQNPDRGDFLESVPSHSIVMEKTSPAEQAHGMNIPQSTLFTSDFNDDDGGGGGGRYLHPPSLPPIRNQVLLNRIATGRLRRPQSESPALPPSLTMSEFNNSHNAKLAIKGRAMMELIVGDLIDEACPLLSEDDLVALRARLMSRELLARFAFAYSLVDAARYKSSSSDADSAAGADTKTSTGTDIDVDVDDEMEVLSRVFLAYVAGLDIEGYGKRDIQPWLKKLYEPVLKDLELADGSLTKVALLELDSLIRLVSYTMHVPQPKLDCGVNRIQSDEFLVRFELNKQLLGVGFSTISAEDARASAARNIVDSPLKRRQVVEILKKSDYLKNVDAGGKRVPNASTPPPPPPPMLGSNSYSMFKTSPYRQQAPPHRPTYSQGSPSVHYAQTSQPGPPSGFHQSQPRYEYNYGQPQFGGVSASVPPAMPSAMPSAMPHPFNGYMPQQAIRWQSIVAAMDSDIPILSLSHTEVYKGARAELYAMLGPLQLRPEYCDEQIGNEFHCLCSLNNTKLGYGIDTSKKKAAQKAAMAALMNKKELMKFKTAAKN
ncbi:uncharacterized protein LODBEIA_P06380 [Lodderomyces beijingensis]|uniref:RNase III domain-containing protein n=1 Tax=Lodderomyces beijingensis TaxID=1775926 RepID=A0ABP0ZE21_9ASCO